MTTDPFVSGQRWLSNNEPELGLGLVIAAGKGRVNVLFPASGQTRQYSSSSAPLTRVAFSEGDEITSHDEQVMLVERVEDEGGVLTYWGGGKSLPESALADSLNFTKPVDRLLNAQLDDKGLFNLRSKALHHRFETLRGHQRGFVGARIELLPHQLFAALQIRRKGIPRLVVADQSGLGKTIEACLVLHRLLVTVRIERALVIVPPASVSRWHYELTRRFHLPAEIVSTGKTKKLPESNVILATPEALDAVAKQTWDLLIVDDADTMDSPVLEKLCRTTPGVVLLTDLPPQVEPEAHAKLQRWLDDSASAVAIAPETVALAEKLQGPSAEPWPEEEIAALSELIGAPVDPVALTHEQGDGRERLTAALLEAIGAGRRLLRNTRATIEGLPEREVLDEKLELPEDASKALISSVTSEFLPNGHTSPDCVVLEDDPRLQWLVTYVAENPKDKIVLIATTAARAAAIAGHLGEKAALHHDGLPLAARDLAIQRFSEKDARAAAVLVCSECGPEGRSLPFAHHLVLFDLPPDPLRIQKRIGSLDRFGHMAKVRLHIPYIAGTPSEVFFRWMNEALHLFERPLDVAHRCGVEFSEKVRAIAAQPKETWDEALAAFLPECQARTDELKAQVAAGRDRLTELSSFRPLPAHRLVESVRRLDSDLSLDFLMLRLFDHFGFDAEDVGERTYNLRPREKDRDPKALPEIGAGGQLVTFERQKALAKDDLWFLTWDHPLIMQHIELLLRTTQGNSCYAVWEDMRSQIVLLEALFRVELANPPKKLYPTRFFSPAGVRLIVNHELQEVSGEYPMELINKNVRNGRREWIRTNNAALRRLLPRMLEDLTTRAQSRAAEMSAQALADLDTQLLPELERLKLLKSRGGPASDFEIQLVESEYQTLKGILAKPMVRLDSLRLVRRGPTGKGI